MYYSASAESIILIIIWPKNNAPCGRYLFLLFADLGFLDFVVIGLDFLAFVMIVPAFPARAWRRCEMSVMIPMPPFFAKAVAASTFGSIEPGLKQLLSVKNLI